MREEDVVVLFLGLFGDREAEYMFYSITQLDTILEFI